MRHLISLKDWSGEELAEIINKALEIKNNPEQYADVLKRKTMIMLFEKSSTRTRLSFETGMTQLGGHAIFLDKRTTQFMIADFIDEIRATMRFGDILMYRAMKHEDLMKAAEVATIPVVNALDKKYHPCQALSDALIMVEKSAGSLEDFKGKKVVWLGLANNVSNSLMQVTTKLGGKFVDCVVENDEPAFDQELLDQVKDTGLYEKTEDLGCLKDADFVHTDTWIDMEFFDKDGEVVPEYRDELERRKQKFMPYQLSKALLDEHESQAKIMHCMACHTGYEITRDAIDHPNSVIFDQAENRLHAQKAIILKLLSC